jgi:hypothetical protein
MTSVSIAGYGIDTNTRIIRRFPLGNPDHPTGSGVEVRDDGALFFVGVRRGDRWHFVLNFMDETDAARYAHAFHRGITWKP